MLFIVVMFKTIEDGRAVLFIFHSMNCATTNVVCEHSPYQTEVRYRYGFSLDLSGL